jgi:hypothetical protein
MMSSEAFSSHLLEVASLVNSKGILMFSESAGDRILKSWPKKYVSQDQ